MIDNDNQLITKSNELIQNAIDSMKAKELKLMAVLLAEYKHFYDENNLCTQTILNRNEFLKYLDITNGGKNYEYLDIALKSFSSKAFCSWVDPVTNLSNITFYFKNITYNRTDNGNTDIVFNWNEEMKPFIVGLDKNFTKLLKRAILSLQSKKAMVLYELLKSYSNKRAATTLTIQELRDKLDMNSPSYKVFRDFFKRGIDEPLKEINEKTDIYVTVTKNKNPRNKRQIESLTFKIKNQEAKTNWLEQYPNVYLTEGEYNDLFHSGRDINLVKQCFFRLDKFIKENPTKRIRSHYNKLIQYYNKWAEDPAWKVTGDLSMLSSDLDEFEKRSFEELSIEQLGFDGKYHDIEDIVNDYE